MRPQRGRQRGWRVLMAALVLQYCVCLTASIRLRSTPHMDADCFYNNKIFGKLKASSFVQLAEGVAGKKCEEMPTVAECAMLGATLSGEDKCTWCVQGTITKCTKCKFAPMYFEQGFMCAPDLQQCKGQRGPVPPPMPTPPFEAAPKAPKERLVPPGAEWDEAMLCRHIVPHFYDKAHQFQADPEPAFTFKKECVTLLGEVCGAQCVQLAQLYDEASRPGQDVSGRAGNANPWLLAPYGNEGKGFNIRIVTPEKPEDRKLAYRMTQRDCEMCMLGLDCVPSCLTTGMCVEDPQLEHGPRW